jgi:uncharacterized protein (TIGR03083 family)
VELDAFIAAIEREARAFATAALRDTSALVPSCPEWTMTDLVAHLGMVHRWAAMIVRTQPAEFVRRNEKWTGGGGPEVVAWFEEGAADLIRVLREADPDAPLWTLMGPGQARFWMRRQAQETAVHRWDAELAAFGDGNPIDSDLAADGIDEAIEVFLPRFGKPGRGETFHFHRTDGDGEWMVTAGADGLVVERAHGKGDLALRGAASDLLLFLWHRVPVDRLEVFGDAELISRWFELAQLA